MKRGGEKKKISRDRWTYLFRSLQFSKRVHLNISKHGGGKGGEER